MQNTVFVERKLRRNLTYVLTVLIVFFGLMIAMLVTASMIDKQNLNGRVLEITGTVEKAERDGSIAIVTLNDGNNTKEYNAVWNHDKYTLDWDAYVGKTVTLVICERTFASGNSWALGLKTDDGTNIDYEKVLQEKRAGNKEMLIVSWVVFAIIGVTACGIFIWRTNVNPVIERPLAEQYAEYLTPRQPTCPERKKLLIALGVWALLMIVFIILLICFSPEGDDEPLGAAAIVFLTLTLVTMVGGMVALPVISKTVIFRKEINFYAEKLPFDFTDISFAPMRKKVKIQLQKEIIESRAKYPHIHSDGGNGYDVEFTPAGINLYTNYDFDGGRISADSDCKVMAQDITEVFPDMPKETNEPSPAVYDTSKNLPELSLTYDELNFEAVAHYRRNDHPMMIIVKSRLAKTDLPEEFTNDLHIALDVHVLETIKAFNVPVENLQFILDNKKPLMLENCRKRNRAKSE